ncbi:MAG: ABC transporter permease [Myxococcales bacterium]|nr:ABC transporter permease [Myxococcales bacterium]
MLEVLEALLFLAFDYAPALVFASLGAVLSERAGVVNVGVEGMMRAGAFAAAVGALVVPTPLGVVLGMLAGACLGAVHAYLCIRWRSEQVVSGMAINLVALAAGTFLLEALFAPTGTPPIAQLERWSLPLLKEVPIVRAASGHSALTYLALALPLAFHLALWRTAFGLRVRAAGEKPAAAETLGVSVSGVRYACVVGAGLLAGLGGATLSTSTLDRFEHHMPAGLGFMAVAAMVFGRWTPLGAFAASAFFSLGNALRIGVASSAPAVLQVVPQGFLLALPYALTLLVLGLQRRRGAAPAALGVPYDPETR